MQAADAAVGGIKAALQKAPRLQPVDQAAHGDGLDLAKARHFVLGHARLARQAGQDDALGAGHAVGAGPAVETGPHQAGHVIKLNKHLSFHRKNITCVIITINIISHACSVGGGCGNQRLDQHPVPGPAAGRWRTEGRNMEAKSNPAAAAILGLLIAMGLAAAGYFVSTTLYKARLASNTVTVKGFAERDVKADLALCGRSAIRSPAATLARSMRSPAATNSR